MPPTYPKASRTACMNSMNRSSFFISLMESRRTKKTSMLVTMSP